MKKKCEYIAYKGETFTIEWYFDDRNQSEALEYYNSLTASERIQLLKLFKHMGDIKDKTKFMRLNLNLIAFYVFLMKVKSSL